MLIEPISAEPSININNDEEKINLLEDTSNSSENALGYIASYYFAPKKHQSKKFNLSKFLLLNFISLSSMWLFYTTSGDAAGNNETLKIRLIVAGMGINFLVTWNTSEAFLNYIQSRIFPPELIKFVDKKKIRGDKIKTIIIAGIAFINATPIALAVFTNSKKNIYSIIEAAITQIDNTFIHTFPTLIVAENIILRNLFLLPFFPLLAVYYCGKFLTNYFSLSSEEITHKNNLEIRKNKLQLIKQALKTTLKNARHQIEKNSFNFEWQFNPKNILNPKFNSKLPDHLKLYDKNIDGMEYWLKIAAEAPQKNDDKSISPLDKFNHFIFDITFGYLFYLAGTTLINATVSGFYKNTYDDFSWINNPIAQFGITLYPNLLLSVLVSYFSARFFRNILYEGLIVTPVRLIWQSAKYAIFNTPITVDPFPTGFKRYPKTTAFFIIISYFFARDSYGTALALIKEHFGESEFDEIRPYLIACASYGMLVFNYKNAIEFILDKSIQFAQKFGGNDNKASAILSTKILALEDFIDCMDDEQLIESLKGIKPEDRETLSGMTEHEFNNLLNDNTKINKNTSNYWKFWQPKNTEKDKNIDQAEKQNLLKHPIAQIDAEVSMKYVHK